MSRNAEQPPRKDGETRRANAIMAAALVVFFFIHMTVGALFLYRVISGELAFLAWVGAAICGVHILVSIATSAYMLTDTVRPPSHRKKMHLLLKWITGVLVLLVLALHLSAGKFATLISGSTGMNAGTPLTSGAQAIIPIFICLVLLGITTAHAFIGVKSFTRDLNMPKSTRIPMRAGMIILAVFIGIPFLLVLIA